MSGQLSVPEAQHYHILCNIFGAQCGARSILDGTRLNEAESISILYLINVSLVFISVAENIYRIHDSSAEELLSTPPPEELLL